MSEFTSESTGLPDPAANQRHWNFWKEKLGVPYFSNSTENVVLATRNQSYIKLFTAVIYEFLY